MIKMNEEELNDIQELIERKLLMAEVMGGLTSHDKKFINLWNYTIKLQNNWNELKKWLASRGTSAKEENDALCYFYTYKKMEEMEGNNDK